MKFDDFQTKPWRGVILASAPQLMDPNFRETLIYLAESEEKGALGFILNRPVGKHLRDIIRSRSDVDEALLDIPVFFGGPVHSENLFLVLFQRGQADDEISCRIDAPVEQLDAHIRNGTGWVRACLGYSGWGEGQLKQEIDSGAWIIQKPHLVLLNENPGPALWSAFVSNDQRWRSLLSYLPDDPHVN